MHRAWIRTGFVNAGHFLVHYLMLVYASVAAYGLAGEWGLDYAGLVPYATPGFVAFGLGALPAGWLADRWSRHGMLRLFFIGAGASAILTGCAQTPLQLGIGLTLIGVFASIYHPVGLALIVQGRERIGLALAINGVWGNLGIAGAALATGALVDLLGWRGAFVAPGALAIALGFACARLADDHGSAGTEATASATDGNSYNASRLPVLVAIALFAAAADGFVFQSTTFALPAILDERLPELAGSASRLGALGFVVFALAAFAQLGVGYLLDRYPLRLVFAGLAAAQAILFFGMMGATGASALAGAIAFMFAVFGAVPVLDVLVGRIARAEWRSRAYALSYVVGFGVSASALPAIAWLYAGGGFDWLFAVLAALASGVFVAALCLPESRVREPAQVT